MKTNSLTRICMLCCIALCTILTGCKKNNDFDSYLKFNVNNTTINAESDFKASPKNSATQGFLQLEARWSTGSVELTLHNFNEAPGTYNIGPQHYAWFFLNSQLHLAAHDLFTNTTTGGGSITFTEVSKDHVKGSFNYTVVKDGQNVTISNGEFALDRKY